ncbi:MAG TPA: pyrimidine 5'-nucleotidase [Dongiaceae bacterium]|jgi:putative hydrolase of the HAD superfamily|nr:pyrimidine 5'-nucleotidase [Dongiaceae bacterium]
MPQVDLSHVEFWIFDLDNTLYPARCRLFDQVDRRIGLYIQELLNLDPEAARALQKRYFRDHTTTLKGLMVNHGIDPAQFLEFVHQIDVSGVAEDPVLERALERLPGKKLIYTNGSVAHARNVMHRLGISHHFKDIFDIVAAEYLPKPADASFAQLIATYGIAPERAVFIDDMARNLKPAAALGMTTVLVASDHDWAQPTAGEEGFIDHTTDNLAEWLSDIALSQPGN